MTQSLSDSGFDRLVKATRSAQAMAKESPATVSVAALGTMLLAGAIIVYGALRLKSYVLERVRAANKHVKST